MARSLFPVTEPAALTAQARTALADDALWDSLIESPIGATIESTFRDDLVRGVVLTDALIGTFAPNVDETLAANRCFLYHVIGNGTGRWDVPIGGMGAVTAELLDAARRAGARIRTGAEVTSITPDGEVGFRTGDHDHEVVGGVVLANMAPPVLSGRCWARTEHGSPPEARRSRSAGGQPAAARSRIERRPGRGFRRNISSTSCGPSSTRPTPPQRTAGFRCRCRARSTVTR